MTNKRLHFTYSYGFHGPWMVYPLTMVIFHNYFSLPDPDDPCMEYLRVNHPNVGKYTIHGAYGRGYTLVIPMKITVKKKTPPQLHHRR